MLEKKKERIFHKRRNPDDQQTYVYFICTMSDPLGFKTVSMASRNLFQPQPTLRGCDQLQPDTTQEHVAAHPCQEPLTSFPRDFLVDS